MKKRLVLGRLLPAPMPLGLIILAFLLNGCTLLRPETKRGPTPRLSASELIARIQHNDRSLRSLRGLMRVSLRRQGKMYRFDEAILIKRPSSLRMETLGFLGQSAFSFATDGISLHVFVPKERKFYVGQASTKNLSRLFPIPLSIEELVALASGRMPSIQARDVTLDYIASKGLYRLRLSGSNQKVQILWVRPQEIKVIRGEILDRFGRPFIAASFSDFQRIDGIDMPFKIELEDLRGSARATLHYQEIEINPPLRAELFLLQPPQGLIEIYPLD